MPNFHSYSARLLSGDPISLSQFRDQVVLVVNVASQCGFTPQYQGLQALYDRYKDRGFAVLGFPCNQFGQQEPGGADQIQTFCESKYAITFPLFEKINVNGPDAHPLYVWLKQEKSGLLGTRAIKWNFTKFLLGRDGEVIGRYGSTTKPAELAADIERALNN